jgi:endonuclease/exonuclease/phosphatase family metal-dependent hydrolase
MSLRIIVIISTLCVCHYDAVALNAPWFRRSDTLRVMFYNVENLFDLEESGREYARFRVENATWNAHTYERKRYNIASVIAAHHPDILGLCEIETERALKDLQTACRMRGHGLRYRAIADRPNPVNTCTAILSRYPIVKIVCHGAPKTGAYYTRNILQAHIAIGADTLIAFVNHWPSKRWPESARIASADSLMRAISRLPPGADYLILGDLNANYDEAESGITYGLDNSHGVTSINHRLGTVLSQPHQPTAYVDERRLRGPAGQRAHYDLWLETPEWRRFSAMYRGHRQTPDHIIVGRAMLDSAGISYVDNSFSSSTWQGRLLRDRRPYRWQIRRTKSGVKHLGAGYSDHLPISALLHRGPFAFAARDCTSACTAPDTLPSRLGLEWGMQGWAGWSSGIWVRRDTTEAADGCWSLRIEGKTRRNATAARTVLIPGRFGLGSGAVICFSLKGLAAPVFRTRRAGGSWDYHCWNGQRFEARSQASYKVLELTQWHEVRLLLGTAVAAGDTLELEVRTGKGKENLFWIDNLHLRDSLP